MHAAMRRFAEVLADDPEILLGAKEWGQHWIDVAYDAQLVVRDALIIQQWR